MKDLFVYATSYTIITGGIWSLFTKIAEVSSEEFNAKVRSWIQNINYSGEGIKSKEIVYGMFILYFGDRHFSWRCFYRSVLYTTAIFFLIAALSGRINELLFGKTTFDGPILGTGPRISENVVTWLIMVFQDFFSLLITRLLLKEVIRRNLNSIKLIIFINFIFSLLLSALFSGLFYELWIMYNSMYSGRMYGPLRIGVVYAIIWPFRFPGMFLCAVYLGCVWIAIIQVGAVLSRYLSKMFSYFTLFRSALTVKENPIKALGAILILVTTILYIIGLPILIFS